ncbi:MAG: RidA family protein, partial [Candidatus Acidiferrales bacterium]
MKKEIKHSDSKVEAINYSAGVLVDGWLYISGQGPINIAEGKIERGSIEEETRLTLGN